MENEKQVEEVVETPTLEQFTDQKVREENLLAMNEPQEPVADDVPAEQSVENKRSAYHRIKQLVGQKKETQEKYNELQAKYDALIEQQNATPQQAPEPQVDEYGDTTVEYEQEITEELPQDVDPFVAELMEKRNYTREEAEDTLALFEARDAYKQSMAEQITQKEQQFHTQAAESVKKLAETMAQNGHKYDKTWSDQMEDIVSADPKLQELSANGDFDYVLQVAYDRAILARMRNGGLPPTQKALVAAKEPVPPIISRPSHGAGSASDIGVNWKTDNEEERWANCLIAAQRKR